MKLDEIFAGWNCFYKTDKIPDFESNVLKQRIEKLIEKRVLEARYVNESVIHDLAITILDSTPDELKDLYPKLEALAGHIEELPK